MSETTTLPFAAITVGTRDRADLGDIEELADSIDAVGLLHPVVVTTEHVLVAGGRRLAALNRLGWHAVPVTVVTLATVEAVLRAEAEENTCRKPLTPVEALSARERRARILAPAAAQRTGGRPSKSETAPKLGAVSSRPDPRVAKAAAVGTGYSGSTLDKVAGIRDAAERESVRHGGHDVPVPEPVREVARKALADVSRTGAAVDRAHRQVRDALDRHVSDDAVVQARWAHSFQKALVNAHDLLAFDPAEVAKRADADLIAGHADVIGRLVAHHSKCTGGPRLQVVNGENGRGR